MRVRYRGRLAAGVLLATMAALPAAVPQAQQHGTMQHGAAGTGAHGDAMGSAMRQMQQGMAIEPSGDPDVDFARMMIPHHQGAIDMARSQLESGKDPAMRRLAQEIIEAQEREIAVLREWLAQHPR